MKTHWDNFHIPFMMIALVVTVIWASEIAKETFKPEVKMDNFTWGMK